MQYYLCPECYDDDSRRKTTQIHADIALAGLPTYKYGQAVQVGDDADPPESWPRYYVAHFPHMVRIDDPAQPGHEAVAAAAGPGR